jgi:hypothetical protein
MEKIWTTKDGTEIPLRKLEDSHLLNIKKFIERRAKEGVEVFYDFGYCGDDDFMTGDIEIIYGEQVKKLTNYKDIIDEIKRRKLN